MEVCQRSHFSIRSVVDPGGFAIASGSENKINIAVQAMVNDVSDMLRFVHKKGA